MDFAVHEFRLMARQKDGSTLREHLERQAQSGRMLGQPPPALLAPKELPECAAYLWRWFIELSCARSYSEAGPLPISHAEMLAWARLTRNDPDAWEIAALREIDRAYLAETMKKG